MRNPWLDIPAHDYEGHMNSPAVDQLSALARLFGEALALFRPTDVLLLGCATGNGLDEVDPNVTRHITGVDINPNYLARVKERYPQPMFGLTLQCADAATIAFEADAFDLVHCALVLEYLDWRQLITAVSPAIRTGGGLCVVLQRPSTVSPAVTPTNYPSLQRLEDAFQFVEPSLVADHARAAGLDLLARRTDPLKSGKAFDVLWFRR